MPPARRRSRGAKQDEDTANTAVNETTEATDEATDDTEGDEAPKAKKAPKVYVVKDADLANSLIGDDFEDEINDGDEVTGEMIDSMRKNKAKWDSPEDGGIKHVFKMNSAIPLRNLYNKWLAENDDEASLDINDVDALYEALIAGEGWVTLSARTGESQGDVKEALKDRVMDEKGVDITEGGRAYGKGDNWTWVTAQELLDAKEANGNGSDEESDEDAEDTEADASDADDTEDEDSSDEEASAPRRRRRAPAA